MLKKQKKWEEMASMIFCLGDLQLFKEMGAYINSQIMRIRRKSVTDSCNCINILNKLVSLLCKFFIMMLKYRFFTDILPDTVEQWESLISLFKSYYDNHRRIYHSDVELMVDGNSISLEEMTVNPLCQKEDIPGSLDDQNSTTDIECSASFDHEIKDSRQTENCVIISRSPCNGRCISWNEMASLMLQHLDESVCVDIWTKMNVPNGCFEQSLYQTCITMALKHRQQRSVLSH